MNTVINNLNWRYATKKYDATRKISNEDLSTIKEAMRLSASAFGLQPYKIFIVGNQELKAKLQPAANGQSPIVDASHIVIFASKTNIGDADIDSYGKNIVETREIPAERIEGFVNHMKSNLSSLSLETRNDWASKQTYIALANLLNAASELKIDATPMEGFNPAKINEVLGLDELGLNTSVIAALGYRHEEDATQHYKKVRKSNEELFINL